MAPWALHAAHPQIVQAGLIACLPRAIESIVTVCVDGGSTHKLADRTPCSSLPRGV